MWLKMTWVQMVVGSMGCLPCPHFDPKYGEFVSHDVELLQSVVAPSTTCSSSVQVLGLRHPLAMFAVG
jgi:hypothetical protein